MARAPVIEELRSPEIEKLASFLEDGIAKKDLIILVARCSVEYEGRGASRLGPGDRLVVIKPDGAVLVHRPTGYSPVNWQPESHVINLEKEENYLVLRSIRRRPKEVLTIYLEEVYTALRIRGLIDKAEFIEYMDEKEIADYLARHPNIIEEGLRIIARERRVGEGYVDILALDKNSNHVVIEVKRVTANEDAVRQLYSYVEELKRANPDAPIRGILVAPSITKNALILLSSLGLEFRRIDPAKLHREAKREKQQLGTRSLLEYLKRGQIAKE